LTNANNSVLHDTLIVPKDIFNSNYNNKLSTLDKSKINSDVASNNSQCSSEIEETFDAKLLSSSTIVATPKPAFSVPSHPPLLSSIDHSSQNICVSSTKALNSASNADSSCGKEFTDKDCLDMLFGTKCSFKDGDDNDRGNDTENHVNYETISTQDSFLTFTNSTIPITENTVNLSCKEEKTGKDKLLQVYLVDKLVEVSYQFNLIM